MRKASVTLLIYAMCAVVLITAAVWLSVRSLGAADGETRTAHGSPDIWLGVGAPRSQLELERMFSSMSRSYLENGRRIFEPLGEEYKASIDAKKANGESLSLSVEEVLYLINDSTSVYENYDIVKLVGAAGADRLYPIKDLAHADEAYNNAAMSRIKDIIALIKYRLEALSSGDVFVPTDGGYMYIPTQKSGAERRFVIKDTEILYLPDAEREISLYPSESEAEGCDISVICESKKLITSAEKALLENAGYENIRNVTPDFWYGHTSMRMLVSGGKMIFADAQRGEVCPVSYGDGRVISIALFGSSVCFAVTNGEKTAVFELTDGEMTLIYEAETTVAVYETETGVAIYEAERLESKSYMVKLIRRGEAKKLREAA